MNGFEIFLCVLAGIILFFVLVLSIPVHVSFSYNDKIHLSVRYLFLKFEILPLGEKKKKPKKEKKPKEEKPKQEKEEKPKEKKPNKLLEMVKANGFNGMMDVFSKLGDVLFKYGEKLLKAFKFNDIYVYSLIGTGDAASTAIQYGETCRKVYPVIGFICGHSLVRHYDIDISADFLANSSEGKTSFDFMLNVRKLINSTVGMLMRLVFRVALKFLKNGKAKNAEAEPAEAKTEAKTA